MALRRMSRRQLEMLLQHPLVTYGVRIVILYGFSVVFRSFDMSFASTGGSSFFRKQSFSLMFVALGLLIWLTGEGLSRFLQKRMTKKRFPYSVVLPCLGLVLFGVFAAFLFGLTYSFYDIYFFNNYEAWKSFSRLSYDLIFGAFIFYLLILSFNGLLFYYKNWQEARLNAERLKRENMQARYDVLKSQIDPHFFFNSLSVLTGLVYQSADLSAEYITQLSKCYRYILDQKEENLVPVHTELSFLESYLFLIRIRHQSSIRFHMDTPSEKQRAALLPPSALQMLVENAVKHNRFAVNAPLDISIRFTDQYVIVSNDLRKRNGIRFSTGVGLSNIRKRYELITGATVDIKETCDHFTVQLPLLPEALKEQFNQ
ncbi:sensor histidine kinase [Niabella drilacis]|uniref:sensor histidine kinase n=1 Tax=Niabella drilacis (strain DSM 25811 / CCM 8410 / CCUG 62505 / LMG 26954 / E90) TaxID=1285928 RepID=UPI001FE029F2|nr:histidine kinase [Niabella drilacis]